MRGQPRIGHDVQQRRCDGFALALREERRTLEQRFAARRVRDHARQPGRRNRVPHHRHFARADLARADLAHCTGGGAAADLLGRGQPVEQALGAVPVVVALLAVRVVGHDGDAEARCRVRIAARESQAVREHDEPALGAELRALGVVDALVEVERRLLRAQDDVLHLLDGQ